MTAIEMAYEKFNAGSQGFCQFIENHGGVELSRVEIERIASAAPNAASFLHIWGNKNWWCDEENPAA